MILRDYQRASIDALFDYFAHNSGNPLLALPTGTGKSVVIAGFLQEVLSMYPGQRIIVATHVKELIEQDLEKTLAVWPTAPAGVYSAGLKRKDKGYPITFVGIASVCKKASMFKKIDLLIIDEAHLVGDKEAGMYQTFISQLRKANEHLKVIGLTATAYRLGLGCLTNGSLFDDIALDLTTPQAFNWFIDEGYLTPLIPKRPGMEYDVTGVGKQGGEYILKQLQNAVDRPDLTGLAVEEIIRLGHERKHWLVFATGIDHAIRVQETMAGYGVPAAVVHSDLTTDERDEAINGFLCGKYRALINNNILTTGFDFPAMDLIACLRPTSSTGLWVQMLGRGTRPLYGAGFDLFTKQGRLMAIHNGGKRDCLVLDFAGNTRRLGPINDPVLPKRKGEKGNGDAPVKVCEHCSNYNHASVRVCVYCGFEFPKILKIQGTAYTDEVLRTSMPQIEQFDVDKVLYQTHRKKFQSALPTLKVSYFCGLRVFHEWVCFEHDGYARKKAIDWWAIRSDDPVPETVIEAREKTKELKAPKQISVWLNKKYPEVTSYGF